MKQIISCQVEDVVTVEVEVEVQVEDLEALGETKVKHLIKIGNRAMLIRRRCLNLTMQANINQIHTIQSRNKSYYIFKRIIQILIVWLQYYVMRMIVKIN